MQNDIVFNSDEDILDYIEDLYHDYLEEPIPMDDIEIGMEDRGSQAIITITGTATIYELDLRGETFYETKYHLKKFCESVGFEDVQFIMGDINYDDEDGEFPYPLTIQFTINFDEP